MKRFLLSALLLSTALLSLGLMAQGSPFGAQSARSTLIRSSVLPAEEAFRSTVFILAPGTVVLRWEIMPDYYIYQDSLAIEIAGGQRIPLGELPHAEEISDEFFGMTKVYFDQLFHEIPLSAFPLENNTLSFRLFYQGCAKDKYCYPMQQRTVELSLPE